MNTIYERFFEVQIYSRLTLKSDDAGSVCLHSAVSCSDTALRNYELVIL